MFTMIFILQLIKYAFKWLVMNGSMKPSSPYVHTTHTHTHSLSLTHTHTHTHTHTQIRKTIFLQQRNECEI
jgi:hypothetical protein